MMTERKRKRGKNTSIEELYQNKNFIPPKEKNLETIFEEPRQSKDGAPILTSVRKFKRYLHFDTTEGKIHKRKLKAKKCINKLRTGNLRTRSASKLEKYPDISVYIAQVIGDSSDSEMSDTHLEANSDDIEQSRKRISSEVNDSFSTAPSSDRECEIISHSNEIYDSTLEEDKTEVVDTKPSSIFSEELLHSTNDKYTDMAACDSPPKNQEVNEEEKESRRSSCVIS